MPSNETSVCERCGGTGWIRLPPSIEHPNGSMQRCICLVRRLRQRKLQQLMAEAGTTAQQLQAWSFDTFHPDRALGSPKAQQDLMGIKRRCQAFAEDPKGWLVLSGQFGCGKSHLGYAIIGACFRKRMTVYACSVPDMLESLRQGMESNRRGDSSGKRLQTIRQAQVLLLDDLGAENQTAWSREKLYQIVDHRYRQRLPMVVTTNVNLYEPEGRIEPRVLSRLLDGANREHGLSQLCLIRAGDYRTC